MRLREITDDQKTFITMKGLKHNFEDDYNDLKNTYNSMPPGMFKNMVLASKKSLLKVSIEQLLAEGFDENDPDIIRAKEIYEALGK